MTILLNRRDVKRIKIKGSCEISLLIMFKIWLKNGKDSWFFSTGHQSEDDGYMSMNGRKAKMALIALRPVPDCPEPQDLAGISTQEFPPPPEEAERIISTLLPM